MFYIEIISTLEIAQSTGAMNLELASGLRTLRGADPVFTSPRARKKRIFICGQPRAESRSQYRALVE